MTNEQIAEKLATFLDGAAPYLGDDYPVIEAAIARLRAPAALPWQPIETAPEVKGDFFFCRLAWGPEEDQSTGDGFRWNGRWFAAGLFHALGQERSLVMQEVEVQPTHWMEKPAAPAPSGVSAPAAGVPAGCKLVPEWPTDEMLDAARAENDKWPFGAGHMNIYRAMLAAAPAANAPVNEQMLEALETAFAGDLTYLSDNAMIPRQSVVMARLAIRDARAALAHAQSDSAGDARDAGWVCVTDRLPDDDGQFVVATQRFITGEPCVDIVWFRRGTGEFDALHVTHWMPLPSVAAIAASAATKGERG